MLNWFGMKSHPSDELFHWSERTHTKEFKSRVKKIRKAWNLVHSTKKLSNAFNTLYRAATDLAYEREAEIIAAGEDL